MSELIYLLAAVLFILSIRGLSAPRSARLGNFLGIAGMTLAIVAALALIPPERLLPVVLALAAGGVIGVVVGLGVSLAICMNTDITFSLNTFAIWLGVGFSAAVGIIFGWAPARKAKRPPTAPIISPLPSAWSSARWPSPVPWSPLPNLRGCCRAKPCCFLSSIRLTCCFRS